MNILAVESSCDETAVAIVSDGRQVLTDQIASQVDLHRIYGGVVPEIASRMHIEAIYGLADQALEAAGLNRKDIDAIAPYTPGLILLPKTGSAADVLAADENITQTEEKLGLSQGTIGLMPLIETAMGVENAFAIASATKRVKALFLGAEDLTADLQCKRTKEGREIEYARTRLVMAARAAGVDVYDTPFTDVNDDEGIEIDALLAKSLGFSGKASISPRHVEVINRVFSPTMAEIDYAYEVMEAIALAKQQGKGAIALRGKMIDAPIVMRAQRTIAMAEALGLGRREEV